MRIVVIPSVLVLVILWMTGCGGSHMFKTPEHESKIMALYHQKQTACPVSFDTMRIRSRYGTTHVRVIGSPDRPPLVFFQAMGMTSMMWLDNIEALSRDHRAYAVDALAEVVNKKILSFLNAEISSS